MKSEYLSYYLAPVSYYAQLAQCDVYRIDANEPYRKQTLRNRCWIASPNGPLSLTVPVVKFVPYRTPMRDIRISDHGNWRHLHWNALQSSYGRTPFFEFYADEFAPFYERHWDFLVDYNQALQDLVSDLIGGEWKVEHGETQRNDAECQVPDAPVDQYSASEKEGHIPPYYQLFSDRHGFMSDLSIVDLLFNIGPESLLYLNNFNEHKVFNDPNDRNHNA